MLCKIITYKTLIGEKKVAHFNHKMDGKWIVYESNKPTYLLDCYDLKNESGLRLNDLLFSEKKTIKQIIDTINKKHQKRLSIKKPPFFEVVKNIKTKEIHFKKIPFDWLF